MEPKRCARDDRLRIAFGHGSPANIHSLNGEEIRQQRCLKAVLHMLGICLPWTSDYRVTPLMHACMHIPVSVINPKPYRSPPPLLSILFFDSSPRSIIEYHLTPDRNALKVSYPKVNPSMYILETSKDAA
ncbi:hypothetical protein OPV22_023044 [Ensete ventricosum]|uniref:Uncharacterized protein n=1 Tax=Ensete ventricosum TaxID=4639 RepID=A0AAV8QUC7_ENSVE|nr:hypothetical protein OPV22_023044 [Ensete ventricosum]